MNKEQYTDMYQRHYLATGRKGAGTLEHEQKWAMWVEQGYKPTMFVLDYGCGVGSMAPHIRKEKYLGVDISEEAIRLARMDNPKHDFEVMEIGELNLPKKVDFVVAAGVFTHTPQDLIQDSLGDLKRNMKKSGFGIVDIIDEEGGFGGHVMKIPLADFMQELDQAGFTGQEIQRISWENGFTHTYIRIEHKEE